MSAKTEGHPKSSKGRKGAGGKSPSPLDTLSEFIDNNFPNQMTELEDSVEDFPQLKELAILIHNLIQSADQKPLSIECANELELGMSILLSELSSQKYQESVANKSFNSSKQSTEYASFVAQNPSDANVAQLQIIDLQRENTALRSELDDCYRQLSTATKELDEQTNKVQQLLKELENQTNDHKDKKSQLDLERSRLEDKLTLAEDREKRFDDKVVALEKHVKLQQDEIAANKREIKALHDRLEKKNRQINKLRAQLKKAGIDYQELQQSMTESEMNLSQQFMNQSKMQDDKAKAAFAKLLKYTKQQAAQLNKLTEANRKAAEVIDKQGALLDEFESAMNGDSAELDETRMALDEAQRANEQLSQELDETTNILEARTEELTELRRILSECLDATAPKYTTTQEELPDLIRFLASTRIDEESAETLRKLTATCDGITRFCIQMLRGQRPDIKMLKGDAKPIIEDPDLKYDTLDELSNTLEFVQKACFSSAEEDPAMKFLSDASEDTSLVKLDNSADLSAAAVLALFAQKYREFTQNQINELVQVRDVLPFACTDAELPSAVAQYISELQPVFDQLLDVLARTLRYHGSTADMFACLCKYIEETAAALQTLDEDVRPLIGFSGKVVNMPGVIAEALVQLKADADATGGTKARELTNTMIQAEKDRAGFTRRIKELEGIQSEKEAAIAESQKQLEKSLNKNEELKKENTAQLEKIEELKKEIEDMKDKLEKAENAENLAKSENERLTKLVEERSQAYDNRLKDAVEHQRALDEEETDRIKKQYEGQLSDICSQLSKALKKATEQRKKAQQVTELYNELSSQTRQTLMQHQQERMNIEKEMEAARNDRTLLDRIEKLESRLADAKAKNRELLGELARAGDSSSAMPRGSPHASPMPSPRSTTKVRSPPSTPRSASNAAAASKDPFIAEVGRELDAFIGRKMNWTRQRVVATVEAIIARIRELEADKDRSKGRLQSLRTSHHADDWATWADRLLAETGRGYRAGISDSEKMKRLEDLVAAGSHPARLIGMVDSLRAQKVLLKGGLLPAPAENGAGRPTAASLAQVAAVVRFVGAMRIATQRARREPGVVARHTPHKTTNLSFQ